MIGNIAKFCASFFCIFGLGIASADEIYPFFLQRQDGTILEGYLSPPSTSGSPIIFAIQGSTCESTLNWHKNLCDQANALGLGMVTIEKQGISKEGIDFLEYHQTNCLPKRQQDTMFCLENMHLICPGWEGKMIFWGESEGGIIAASLAAQTPSTAAVLLFAMGGGLKPREEVKYSLRTRLEKHGAVQDEIDQYMVFLEEQMDTMTLDPTPNKQFLGNTYKWWASLLAADEASLPLNQHSLPIYLAHGIEDNQIPILSADLAAKNLNETNTLIYHRLEGYGHDLDTADVHAAACQWLNSILCGNEQSNIEAIGLTILPTSSSSEDWKTDIAQYTFSLGRGEAHGEAKGSRDSEGNERASVDVGVTYETDNGTRFDLDAGASASKDRQGNAQGEVHVEGRVSKDF
jgi:hypothetical protein